MKLIDTIKQKFFLGENAKLFDTKEYLLKTFIAVIIAGLIGKSNSYVSKDMISLLFGMMLTLEPVNMSGIRSGLSQVEATVIGAIVSVVVIAIFGYGIVPTAIVITLTLYVCMLINWRELMVVAVFTAIYMTTFIQTNALGELSSFETFKLRLVALATGIIIAFVVNFLFSLVGYKKMVNKRIYYISRELYEVSFEVKVALVHKKSADVADIMQKIPSLFNTIDWITATLNDAKKDKKKFKFLYRHFDVNEFLNYSVALRGVTHVMYDLCYRVENDPSSYMDEGFIRSYEERLGHFEAVKEAIHYNTSIPLAKWKETRYPWLNHYSKALEKLNQKND